MSMLYKVLIGGTEYGMSDIESVTIERPLFDKLSAGNACSAELEITFWPIGTVPRMAEIIPYARASEEDEWTQLGVFYTDERKTIYGGKVYILAYDSMLKGEVEWIPGDDLEFPMAMSAAISEISTLMGLEIDDRTVLSDTYTLDHPANSYTFRDILRFVAAAHCANWIITAQNKLLLVPLFGSMPEETSLLATADGDVITIGGVRIIV